MSKFNKETFLKLCPYVSEDATEHNDDYIYTRRFWLENYEYDYSHAIVEYLKDCGCRIHKTNWNCFGGFYVYYTRPTKYVCPEFFSENYKGGKHYDSFTAASRKIIFILIILNTVLILGFILMHGGK